MEVRRARTDEALEVADIWLRSRAASVPEIPPPVHADDDVRRWFKDVVLPTSEVWVAELDLAVVALMVIDGEWIEQLYVDPAHLGKGVGSRLLDVAKRQRPSGLQLWTFQANQGARRFYERHGFVVMESTDGENEEGAPDIRYEWRPQTQRRGQPRPLLS